jgi:hypothetical protein
MTKCYKTVQAELTDLNWDGDHEAPSPVEKSEEYLKNIIHYSQLLLDLHYDKKESKEKGTRELNFSKYRKSEKSFKPLSDFYREQAYNKEGSM